jgi:GT2 family glycosyltransferase
MFMSSPDPTPKSLPRNPAGRPRISGKFFRSGDDTFYIKGVTYGTFAPAPDGSQFPPPERVQGDFALMSARGINAVRLYTPPRADMLDAAEEWGLQLMIGIPWTQHVAFLDDGRLRSEIRRQAVSEVRRLHGHPSALLFALGNEIPPAVVRWHGAGRVESFLRELLDDVRQAAPDSYFTYVNYPPTDFLDTDFFDVCSFNVYLHDPERLSAYVARLQHISGHKPLLLAEAGADSIREGLEGQGVLTATALRTAFSEGACGAFAFAWTDEWWRGGSDVDDWAFGLVDRQRKPKPALAAVTRAFEEAPFPASERETWPKVSVVVCAYNAADTLEDCLSSLEKLNYPRYEVILVNDGSKDQTGTIGRLHPSVRTVDVYPNGGLSAARNTGLAHATGDIVAYTDADVRVDPEWLTYLVQPFLRSDVVGSGGPNVVPPDDPWIAQCVARAPGGPTHVLLDDRIAEHVPGCNMAFRREALLAIGGFNPTFLRAGDDVDVCWRLQAQGGKIGFAPAALVWHHHRSSVKAYWRQQIGYGEGELWLAPHHPDKFEGRHVLWRGRIYSPLPFVRSLTRRRVNAGLWGSASFPSVYFVGAPLHEYLPHSVQWQAVWITLVALGVLGAVSPWPFLGAAALGLGLALLAVTLAKCVSFARRSALHGLAPIAGLAPERSPGRYRAMIAWLHFIQPLARLRGILRGIMNPPDEHATPAASVESVWGQGRPKAVEALGVARLLVGEPLLASYWGESWTSADRVLSDLLKVLRASRAGALGVDDGWQHDRDISVALGPWARLDLRALVEEHAYGRVLLRTSMRLRPGAPGLVALAGLALLLAVSAASGIGMRWPLTSLVALGGLAMAGLAGVWRLVVAGVAMQRAVARTAASADMTPLGEAEPDGGPWPRRLRWILKSTAALGVAGIFALEALAIVGGARIAMRQPDARPSAASIAREMRAGYAVRPASAVTSASPSRLVTRPRLTANDEDAPQPQRNVNP